MTFLSDILDLTSLELGKFNFINANCGAGKTTAALKTIPHYLNIPARRTLILIDTVAGLSGLVHDHQVETYEQRHQHSDVISSHILGMTYALFGSYLQKQLITLNDFDYIICDEIHALNLYISIARGQLKHQRPNESDMAINQILMSKNFNLIALNAIIRAIESQQIWVIGMTATESSLYKYYLNTLAPHLHYIQLKQEPTAYIDKQTIEYYDINQIISQVLEPQYKRLFYFDSIKQLKHYKDQLIARGRAAEAIWSPNANELMDFHQLATRDYILTQQALPNDVSDLLINRAYETSINIYDPLVRAIYIHSGNATTRTQARGRLRQDLDIVGYYNHTKLKTIYRQTNQTQHLLHFVAEIPDKYLDTPLSTEDKQQLVKDLKFPKAWQTLKQILLLDDYQLEEFKRHNKKYTVIKTKDELN